MRQTWQQRSNVSKSIHQASGEIKKVLFVSLSFCTLQQEIEEATSETAVEPETTANTEGLAKLDAGKEEDKASVEQKIEEVASAMGLEDPSKVECHTLYYAENHYIGQLIPSPQPTFIAGPKLCQRSSLEAFYVTLS